MSDIMSTLSQHLCELRNVPDPGTLEFSMGAGEWPLRGFIVHYRGEVHAYRNRCPHLGWLLNLKANTFFAPDLPLLQCVGHGALFEPHNGACVAGPCHGRALQALNIEVVAGHVYLRELPRD